MPPWPSSARLTVARRFGCRGRTTGGGKLTWPNSGVSSEQDERGGLFPVIAMLLSRDLGQLSDLRLSERGDVLAALWGFEAEVREWVVLAQPITQGSAHMVRATRVVLRDQALASLFASGR